jgi:polyhydroxybutyrate depolymerase
MANQLLRSIIILFGLFASLVLLGWIVFRILDRTNGRLVSAGEKRSYLLYVPGSYDPSKPTPLVIAIHGFVQWPAHQMHISRWNELADESGFLVVYPSGTRFPKRWRTRALPGSPSDPRPDIDFISDLIDKLEAKYNIDPARIYVNGMSNGAGMTLLLACELSDRIAAIGMVAGAYPDSWEKCRPGRPVPAMVFHGTDDPIVPYRGRSYGSRGSLPSIPEWVAGLAGQNGCTENPRTIPASGDVRGLEYTGCGADVVFYIIQGGGHTWPGGNPIPAWIAGRTSNDIDATRTMWDFFQKHPLIVPEDPPVSGS